MTKRTTTTTYDFKGYLKLSERISVLPAGGGRLNPIIVTAPRVARHYSFVASSRTRHEPVAVAAQLSELIRKAQLGPRFSARDSRCCRLPAHLLRTATAYPRSSAASRSRFAEFFDPPTHPPRAP